MASSTNKSFPGWKTNRKSSSDTNKILSRFTPNNLNLSLSNPNPSTNSWNGGRLAAWVPYQTHDDTDIGNGSRGWNDNGHKPRQVNGRFSTNSGGRTNSPKLSSTGLVPQNRNHPANQDVDSQQGHVPSFDSRKRAGPNTIPVTNECDDGTEYKPNKANGRQDDGVSAQTNSHRFGLNNRTSDRPKKFRRPLTNPYAPNNQSTHIAVQVRKVAPHAEDLQPNEGFTGVKTTIAPGVPKVLSASTSTSRVGLGSKNGNVLRGATNLRRGTWTGKRGNRRGLNLPTKSTQPMQPAQPSFPPSNLPLSNPPRHDPPTPHRLPPVALNKAVKCYKLIPQKRRNQPSPDSVASLSSSSSMSISSLSSESSAPRDYRKKDFSHLLPGGPWKTKRRKTQEQELRQDDLEQHVMTIVSEELPVREDLVDNDGSVEGVESISNGGRVDGPADGTDDNLLQRNTIAEKVKLEPSDYDYELVYPSSSPVPSRPLSNASSTASKAQINDSKEKPYQSCSGATEIKDEPLDVKLADLAPSNNRTSGTERYHPIPPSCLKFHFSSSVNSLFPNPSSSKLNSNTNQTSCSRLVPNPHYNTARSEYTQRAIDELRAKGMIARRALWRDDGLCIDWEKAAVRENTGDAGPGGGGGKNNVKGKERTSDSQTGKRKGARGKEAPQSIGAMFDDLFLLADNNVRVKSEPHPDPRLPDEATKPQSNQSTNSQLKEHKFSPSDVDIIDLTIDEEPSIPSFPNPPQTNSFPNIERQENDVVKSANDRPIYQPPLLVRLGSGRTPSQGSSQSGIGRPESTFHRVTRPSTSLFNSSGLPLDPHTIHDNPSIRGSSMHAPPVIQTTLPTARTLTNIEEANVGETQGSSFTGTDDSGDTEEEKQVRDELGLNPGLNDPDMQVRLDREEHTSEPLEQSFHLIESVELPNFETDSSIRHAPRVEAAQTSSEETRGYRHPSLHRSPTTVVDMGEKAKMERLAIDFLRRYINSWEYDRASLARAYAPNAVFSCSVTLPETSSGISIDKSPTHAFASHFATSMSAVNPNSFTSSRRVRGPPVPIQTPTVITPALLLLDPQRAYTFFPRGGQAEVAYDVLYLGNLGNSPEEGAKSGRSDVLVYLGVQAELKRKTPEHTDDEIWDVLNAENILDLLDPKSDKKGKGKVDEAKLCIGWNFVLCAGGEGEDEFSLQIVSHQMMIRDGA
ncbi:hypothetical protein F5890DRAFT_1511262 [Lentinula detonsa]|uniref:Uncharacterized protein n=1 Tax=Lentinula detonsa TaxID=2804962 RepID=A0AA38Q0N3_9AGAR|nr:hypothetical protein F5890DRAFT_1511262 [Lentinula detonsa]